MTEPTSENSVDSSDRYSARQEVGAVRERRTARQRVLLALSKAPPTAWFGIVMVGIYAFMAVFAPILAPYGEAEIFSESYAPWGGNHLLGTDQIGRDFLSRIIYGARNTIGIALITTLIAFFLGAGMGMAAAMRSGGAVDLVLSRFVDVIMAIPSLIFALILLSIFGSSLVSLVLIIAVLDSTRVFRLTRSVALGVVVQDFVEAANLRGEKIGWIMRREILPNILPPLMAEFGLRFCFVFLTIAALSFLGLGIQPPTADWGSMVRENAQLIQFAQFDLTAGLTPILPAAAIALLTISVNFIVDWLLHLTSGVRDEQ